MLIRAVRKWLELFDSPVRTDFCRDILLIVIGTEQEIACQTRAQCKQENNATENGGKQRNQPDVMQKLSLCCACIDVVLSMTVDSLIGKMRKTRL